MSLLIDPLSSNFLPSFLAGVAVNFEIAAIALAVGLGLGILLAFARLRGSVAGMAASAVSGLMRAAPTFVVMFFLLNALPHNGRLSGVMIVAMSLVPYAAAYVADSSVDALRQLRTGSQLACFLILPNIARAFFRAGHVVGRRCRHRRARRHRRDAAPSGAVAFPRREAHALCGRCRLLRGSATSRVRRHPPSAAPPRPCQSANQANMLTGVEGQGDSGGQ